VTKLRVLDLFSGIGGFSLGLERAKNDGHYTGFETVAFCEIEAFPRKVLAKHWPNVPCYDDVRTLTAERLAADGIAVDVICGGFPCQDISFAGLGAGLAGERSGLFYEVARLVSELGPRYVLLENVGALLHRGMDAVLGTLAEIGYDAEWHCIPASAIGAPHRRDRVWIIAHPARNGWQGGAVSNQNGNTNQARKLKFQPELAGSRSNDCQGALADTASKRLPRSWQPIIRCGQTAQGKRQTAWPFSSGIRNFWSVEPDVGRVANGVPDRAHRLKGLGNAVVPQIPELIGNAILEAINT